MGKAKLEEGLKQLTGYDFEEVEKAVSVKISYAQTSTNKKQPVGCVIV